MARTITVRKYYKPSLGKTVNHEGYTRKVKDAPKREKYERPKISTPKAYIDTVAGRAYLVRTEYDRDGNWNGDYATRDGYWVIHEGKAHHIYQIREKKKTKIDYADLEPDPNAIQEYRAGRYVLRIYADSDARSPRDPDYTDSLLGTMICIHSRYNLGDEQIKASDFGSWDEIREMLAKERNAIAILPLYLYDHSGITMKTTPFGDRFDSGQVGFIYTTKERLNQLGITTNDSAKTKNQLEQEVKTYDDYISGEVYGFKLNEWKDGKWNETDSSWGYYGYDNKTNGIFDSVPKVNWKKV